MKVVELKYKSFTFPLNQKFINSTQSFSQKKIIILRAKDENGNIAFGEVSPLPDFSKEKISDCLRRLEHFSINTIKNFNYTEQLNDELAIFNDIPSLKFGLEQVLIGLMFQNNLNYFNDLGFKKSVKVNGSIGFESVVDTESQISKILDDGISTIKLKIGRNNFNEDLTILDMIKLKFGDKVKLRLDVNGKWSYKEAKENLIKLEQYNLQYVEQPVKNKIELLKLAQQSKIEITPDESIQTFEDAIDFINSDSIEFIILKPTIRLGIFDTLRVIKIAKEKNIIPIITTSFETAIGRSMLISLAGLTHHNYSHGLGLDVLGDSSATKLLRVVNGEIKFNPKFLKNSFNDLWSKNKNI
ncbi:MAG: o-succinylbenzoate synthase [Ignavibacteriae bacterium]|nr:o-succinylbenzoate synthase [Ignavibacteriota bacterium]